MIHSFGAYGNDQTFDRRVGFGEFSRGQFISLNINDGELADVKEALEFHGFTDNNAFIPVLGYCVKWVGLKGASLRKRES